MNTAIKQKLHRILVLMIILMVAPVLTAVAGQPGRANASLGSEEEGAAAVQLPMDRVTIAKKSLEGVTTTIGQTYALSRATIIVGLDGHQVSIRKMLVPCDAEITYKTEQGVRRAQRITITQLGRNTTWQWTSNIPE
jgi:hypothetical protein